MAQNSVRIYPSLLAADMSCLKDEMQLLEALPIAGFHWDIMDHHFVPNLSFGMGVMRSCRRHTSLPFDVHLMVDNPELYFKDCAEIGVNCVYIHAEQVSSVHTNILALKGLGLKAGLVINPETQLHDHHDLIEICDALLIMTVNPGFSGQRFQEHLLEKITKIVASGIMSVDNIMVDGGINPETLAACAYLGVRHFVVGNSLLKGEHGDNRAEVLQERWAQLISQRS